jgi:Spy/CpxP family protein refolding chaperone
MKLEWKQVVISLLIGFVLGAALGWLGSQYSEDWRGKDRYSWMLERFSTELDLTPEQKKEIADILEAKRQSIIALRAEIRPRFEEIRNSAREEIRKRLTLEQQEKFDAMQAEWESRREKRH